MASSRPTRPRCSRGCTPSRACPSALAAARDGIDAVLRDRGLRRTAPEATAESLLRGAHASAVLEGSGSTLDEVRGGRRRRGRGGVGPVVDRAAGAGAGAAPLAAAGAGPAPHAGRRRGGREVDRLGRPRDAEAAAAAGSRRAGCSRTDGPGAAGRGRRARRADLGRAVRLPQRARRAGSRAAGAGRARPRPDLAGGAGGRAPGAASGVRGERCAACARAASRPCTGGCCTPRRPMRPGAEASPLRDA